MMITGPGSRRGADEKKRPHLIGDPRMKGKCLSPRMEDYLEAIYVLSRSRGGEVRISELSEFLGVSKPTALEMVRRMESLGLVEYSDGSIRLREKGRRIGRNVWSRHVIISEFLRFLGVDPETAERDACAMEHCLDERSFRRLVRLFKLLKERSKDSEDVRRIIEEVRRS
jgi:DtxR family Mn-dependent transcriptional regulator